MERAPFLKRAGGNWGKEENAICFAIDWTHGKMSQKAGRKKEQGATAPTERRMGVGMPETTDSQRGY